MLFERSPGTILPATDLIQFFIDDIAAYIGAYVSAVEPPAPQPLTMITSVVPDQKVGPAKFHVVDGVLRVQHQAAFTDAANVRNAESAREGLIDASRQLTQFLAAGNYDRRLVATVEDIQHRLKISQDIIQLGIAAISCQLVCEKFEDELPDVWSAKLRAFSVGVGMYVAQFPDWVRFSDNAAMADFSPDEVKKLHAAGLDLVEGLRGAGPAVDPEVPRTIGFFLDVIQDHRRVVKRTVFAASRSLENLFAAIFRHFGHILEAVPEGVKEGVKLGSKYVTATVLLALAAHAALSIGPAAGRVLQTNWMTKAGKIISEGLKDIKD